jgi:co-chaperonin GroES (HSP10)
MITITGCRLLIKPLKLEEFDEVAKRLARLGFERAETDKRREQVNIDRGIVLQIGEAADKVYIGDLKVGDSIGFTKFGGKFVQDTGSDEFLLIINDEDVICIYKDEA